MSIEARGLGVAIGGKQLLTGVDFRAEPGQVTGLIGPNGAGKSTLMALLAGDLAPQEGTLTLCGVDPGASSPKELARQRAVMLQDVGVSFEFLVRDVVAMGRRPWAGTADEDLDEELISAALVAADVTHLAGRDVQTLSGGERARVALARVLAQHTPVILLDEPTAALDISHQEQVLGLLQSLARQAGVTVVVILHDLNGAATYCDRLVCLAGGTVAASGTVPEVCTADTLSAVYGWPIEVTTTTAGIAIHPRAASAHPAHEEYLSLLKEGTK